MATNFPVGAGFTRSSGAYLDYNSPYTSMWWNYVPSGLTNTGRNPFMIATAAGADRDYINIKDNSGDAGGLLKVCVAIGGSFTRAGYDAGENVWRHVCMRRTSVTSIELIVDGVIQATVTTSTVAGRPTPERHYIGSYVVGTFSMEGYMSDFYSYQESLTLAEIIDQSLFSYPRRTANLFEWLPMYPNSSRNIDFSGNGRDYTEVGSPTNTDSLVLACPSLLMPRNAIPLPPTYYASPLMLLGANF